METRERRRKKAKARADQQEERKYQTKQASGETRCGEQAQEPFSWSMEELL